MENTPTVSKVSVALSDVEKKIIEGLKNKQGSNFSSALRVIVREWDEIKNSDETPITPRPTKSDKPARRATVAA